MQIIPSTDRRSWIWDTATLDRTLVRLSYGPCHYHDQGILWPITRLRNPYYIYLSRTGLALVVGNAKLYVSPSISKLLQQTNRTEPPTDSHLFFPTGVLSARILNGEVLTQLMTLWLTWSPWFALDLSDSSPCSCGAAPVRFLFVSGQTRLPWVLVVACVNTEDTAMPSQYFSLARGGSLRWLETKIFFALLGTMDRWCQSLVWSPQCWCTLDLYLNHYC